MYNRYDTRFICYLTIYYIIINLGLFGIKIIIFQYSTQNCTDFSQNSTVFSTKKITFYPEIAHFLNEFNICITFNKICGLTAVL